MNADNFLSVPRKGGSLVRVGINRGVPGVVATAIPRWTNVYENKGTAITYVDDVNNGGIFVINEDGVYSFTYTDNFSTAQNLGVTKNSTELTTSVGSTVNVAAILGGVTLTSGNGNSASISWSGPLNQGDIIRPHNGASPGSGAASGASMFSIAKLSL